MVEEVRAALPGSLHEELRPEDMLWITSDVSREQLNASEESVLVLDLQGLTPAQASAFAALVRNGGCNPTVVGFGDAQQIENARSELANFDVAFLLRPEGVKDEAALRFVYDQLIAVYAPFTRAGTQFLPRDAVDTQIPETQPATPKQIDPAYSHPPFAFNGDQHAQLLTLVNRTETEERREEE